MKNKWDQQNATDVLVVNSTTPAGPNGTPTSWGALKELFVMHVDLEIPAAADAVSLRSAMASDASFPVVVADFLETWRQPDPPIESLEGLAFIATQIRSLVIKNMGTWRFSVVPRASLAEPALLEVRLVIDLSAVLVKQPHPALTINGLKSPEPAVFFEALRTLMNELQTPANSAQYPGAVAFLGHVYVPASP